MKCELRLTGADLPHVARIERYDETAHDALGTPVGQWVPVAEDWRCRAEPLRGREYMAAQQMQVAAEVRFVGRFRAGVDAGMRVVFRGQAYDIQSAIDVEFAGQRLELMTVAGGRDGR